MRVKITVSQIKYPEKQPIDYSTAVDMYIESAQLHFFANGASTPKLVVLDKFDGVQYVTDFNYSSAITALDAAPSASGGFVLT